MNIHIYTDGGCSGNPGPGGWAYLVIGGDSAPTPVVKGGLTGDGPAESGQAAGILAEQWGAEGETTNNRMELTAVISALEALDTLVFDPGAGAFGEVRVFTDSQYVQKGMKEWLPSWKRNGWKTADKAPVKNRDLWQRLDQIAARYPLNWQWVRGHAGNPYNERCDELTQWAIASIRKRPGR
jgi:ribonuclease HI